MLDDDEPRLDHFEHEAERWDVMRSSPHTQLAVGLPHAEVNPRVLDDGGDFGEGSRCERHRPLEDHGMIRLLRGQKCDRNFRDVPFLTPQARPERRVDHPFDDVGCRKRRDRISSTRPRRVEVLCEMCVDRRCGQLRRWITLQAQAAIVLMDRAAALPLAPAVEARMPDRFELMEVAKVTPQTWVARAAARLLPPDRVARPRSAAQEKAARRRRTPKPQSTAPGTARIRPRGRRTYGAAPCRARNSLCTPSTCKRSRQ